MFSQLQSYYNAGSLKVESLEFCRCKQTLPSCRGWIYLTCYRISPLIRRHHCCCWLYTHKPLSPLNFLNSLLGSVICGCGNPRLHLSRNPPGYGGWERQIWTRVWLVVPGGLHVWNAVRRDSFLCRILGGNLREDHEPQGGLTKLKGVTVKRSPEICPVWPVNTSSNVIMSWTGEIPVPTADHRCFWGGERSDSPTHLQPRAPIGSEWHRGLQAAPLLRGYRLHLSVAHKDYLKNVYRSLYAA